MCDKMVSPLGEPARGVCIGSVKCGIATIC